MVKIVGPLFSLSASGTYRDVLVFKPRGAGVHVANKPVIAKGRSQAQTENAQKIADMAASWSALSEQDKLLWANCGGLLDLSGYAHYWQEWYLQGSTSINPPGLTC